MFSEWFKDSNIYKEKKSSVTFILFLWGGLLINMDPPSPTQVPFLGNIILIINAENKLFFLQFSNYFPVEKSI